MKLLNYREIYWDSRTIVKNNLIKLYFNITTKEEFGKKLMKFNMLESKNSIDLLDNRKLRILKLNLSMRDFAIIYNQICRELLQKLFPITQMFLMFHKIDILNRSSWDKVECQFHNNIWLFIQEIILKWDIHWDYVQIEREFKKLFVHYYILFLNIF
jgi:hypothetical protein